MNAAYSAVDDTEEDSGQESLRSHREPAWKDYIVHGITVFWNVLFALIPPAGSILPFPVENEMFPTLT